MVSLLLTCCNSDSAVPDVGDTQADASAADADETPDDLHDQTISDLPTDADITTTVSGVVYYEDKPAHQEGYGQPYLAEVPLADVELVAGHDGGVVATGSTDPHGAFELVVDSTPAVDGLAPLYVRALTRTRSNVASLTVVRAEAEADAAEVYAARSDLFQLSAGDHREVVMTVAADSGGGAFNIYATLVKGFQFVAPLRTEADGSPPHLTVYYEKGVQPYCGSCYEDLVLQVGSAPDDEDEYDDAVILHEFAHYVEEVMTRKDSPGGPHGPERSWPTLAWSEGFANVFQGLVRDSQYYVDVRGSAATVLDMENVAHDEAFGTQDGTLMGVVSEDLVAAVLWDLYDGPEELYDHLQLPVTSVLQPPFSYFPSEHLDLDRGAWGVDLVDYLDGWFCLGNNHRDAVYQIVVEGRGFPYDFDGPSDCLE